MAHRRPRRRTQPRGTRPVPEPGPVEALRNRARRHARRGDHRKAAVALRRAVALAEDAPSWVMLGDMLTRARRPIEAVHAFKQGLWLHRRAGADRRARTVARMILQIDPLDAKAAQLAT